MKEKHVLGKPKITEMLATTTPPETPSASTSEDNSLDCVVRNDVYILPIGFFVPFFFLSHKLFLPFLVLGGGGFALGICSDFLHFSFPEVVRNTINITCALCMVFGITTLLRPYPRSVLEKIPTVLKKLMHYNRSVITFTILYYGNTHWKSGADTKTALTVLSEKRAMLKQMMGFLRAATVSDRELAHLQKILGIESTFPQDLLHLFEDNFYKLLGDKN